MKKCDECGKRAEGLGTYATQFENITLCAECYESIPALRLAKNKKIQSQKAFLDIKGQAQEQMQQKGYKENVMMGIDHWIDSLQDDVKKKEVTAAVEAQSDSFMMTSGFSFEGYRITAYHGVISGDCVLGTGFLSSWDASWSDTFGVESNAFIDKLKEARNAAKKRAVQAAAGAGGNAIIGVDIDYTMFTSNLIGVIFNGTSVTIEKNE